jgi:hypothetical protein
MTGYETSKGSIAGRIVGSILPATAISKVVKGPSLVKNAIEGAIAANLVEGMPAEDFLNIEKRIKTSAIGATFGAVTPVAIKSGVNLAKSIVSIPSAAVAESEKVMARLMNATHIKDYAFGKNPPKAVIEALGKNLPSSSVSELHQKVQQSIPKYVQKAKDWVTQSQGDKVLNLSENINGTIDDAINEAVKGGKNNQALVTRLNNLKDTLNFQHTVGRNGKIVNTGNRRLLDGIRPDEAVTLKQEIGDLGKWTGNASDDGIVNKTTQKLYGMVRTEIEKAIPSVHAVNETLSGLLSANSLLKRLAVYEHGAPQFRGIGKIAGGAALLFGLASGNPTTVAESVAVLGLGKIANSTEAQTKLAYGLSKMGKSQQISFFAKHPKLQPILEPHMKKFSMTVKDAVDITSARQVKDFLAKRQATIPVQINAAYQAGKIEQ